MSYGKKIGKFKFKVLTLQGHGLGRKKNRKKRKVFFLNPSGLRDFFLKKSSGKAFSA
jgi:hypothetical protein